MIRWLHISDLHLGSTDFSTDELRDELVGLLIKEGLKCDYVFCTGDFKTAGPGDKGFTDDMAAYLKDICMAVGVPVEKLFIVPGNHDINREINTRKDAIKKMMFQRRGYYDPAKGIINPEDMVAIMEGEKDFVNFVSKVLPADRVALYGNPERPHFTVETEDFNILHVDTNIAYTEGQEATNLIVGTHALYKELKQLNEHKPTILLTHYPFTSLLQDEKKYLSAVLQKNEVRLWLAGHEHDQVLQRIHYLDQFQAGELRHEDKANATILVGEYNPQTNRGYVTAYSWFPEGWAKYPLLDLDNKSHVDRYDFELKPKAFDGHSKEYVAAQEANKEHYHRLPNVVEKALLPSVVDDDTLTTLGELLEESWQTDKPHVIMLADGGMGKTTMLLNYCKETDEAALYVSAENLATRGIGIEEYLRDRIYEGDKVLMHNSLLVKGTRPTLTLIVDGLNEVDGRSENLFIREIQRLNTLNGLRIVVPSRSNFTLRYSMTGYKPTTLQPLEDDQISSYFSTDEWNRIVGSVSLHRLLRNPMMVTVYKEICPVIEEYRNVEFLDWTLPVKNSTDLFHDYYVAQLALMMKRGAVEGGKILQTAICLRRVLPDIAYVYERERRMNLQDKDFREMLSNLLQNISIHEGEFASIQEYYRQTELPNLNTLSVTELLITELRLLYRENGITAFPHQMYRDYLSAQWIMRQSEDSANIEDLWNSRQFPYSVMTHIRQGSGAYWHDGIASTVHQVERGRKDDNSRNLIENLLLCFPATDESGVPDYSGLWLKGHQLPVNNVGAEKITLREAEIDEVTLGLSSGDLKLHLHLCLSENHEYLATIVEKEFGQGRELNIFSLNDYSLAYAYSLDKKIAKMEFHGRRLFVVAGNLLVFAYNERKGWHYTGEIGESRGTVMQRLAKIILADDVLYMYYNNRLVTYHLSDCHRIGIANGKFWDNLAEGEDVTSLRQTIPWNKGRRRQTDIVSEVGDDTYRVRSYGDGRLSVECGDEIDCVLAQGKTLLLDAAISGDGKRAVTLGLHLQGGKRKVQLWDLDNEQKIAELECPPVIKNIHLSETGEWILGETEGKTWVFYCEDAIEFWYDEHFVSNHAGRLVTYEDNVIRRNGQSLSLFNLFNGGETELDCPVANPKLVCFLPTGDLAAVDSSGRMLVWNSTWNGKRLTISMEGQEILSIQAIHGQPYIAVFTKDQLIRIYHTGNGQCLRKYAGHSIAKQVVVHQEIPLIAASDGFRHLETRNYYEKTAGGRKMGWWYENKYEPKGHVIDGDILDIAFNVRNQQLVAILANGKIMFCNDKYCKYQDSLQIITALNVDAYDFSECICSKEIKELLRRNGALVN